MLFHDPRSNEQTNRFALQGGKLPERGKTKEMSSMSTTTLKEVGAVIAKAFDLDGALQPQYKPNSAKTFMLRYSRKGNDGEPTETPAQAHWRVALNIASPTVLYVDGANWEEGDEEPSPVNPADLDFPFRTIGRQYNWMLNHGHKLKEFVALVQNGRAAWLERAELYYNELLAPLVFVPNSPTWTGAGTPLGQLAACFVLPLNDSLVAGESSIMNTLREAVAIQKTGGGNGFSFGRLRPAKSRVSTSMGQATGVVGFLSMYNDAFEHIRQGGSRRGANMGVCPIGHPDVIQFINSKTVEKKIANFNISVAITDEFMLAVDQESDWQFVWNGAVQEVEWKGEMVKSVPAKDLFNLIVSNAHIIGDPGALFIDAANRQNPLPHWYVLETTNPCGEQWLGPHENCCLGSIAVQKFVSDDGAFDWARFQRIIELSTEFLDDVIDANSYVDSVPQLEVAAQGGRRIGLGQMGLADALIKLGFRYGGADGLDFASQVTEFMRYHSMLASSDRAAERGSFARIEQSIYDPQLLQERGQGAEFGGEMVDGRPFTAKLWQAPVAKVAHERDFGRPVIDWETVFQAIVYRGMRNSCQGTFAPTGTIATVAGVEGYGGEPIFALSYTRKVMQEGENIELVYLSELFEEALVKAGLDEETIGRIKQEVAEREGSCQGIDEVPAEIQRVFVVALDVTPSEHVWMQAVLQAFVDNSISKTINLANTATVADIDGAYRLAWELGAKGITVYRQGSREEEVLTTKQAAKTGEVEIVDPKHWPILKPLPIPASAEDVGLPSRTFTVRTPFGKVRATITTLEEHPDRPFDIELSIGRGGSDVNAFSEAIGRLASLCLRAGVDADEVVDQLIGIGGRTQEQSMRPDKAVSLPDAIGKLIRRHVEVLQARANGEEPVEPVEAEKVVNLTELCPSCHQATLAFDWGCVHCMNKVDNCTYELC